MLKYKPTSYTMELFEVFKECAATLINRNRADPAPSKPPAAHVMRQVFSIFDVKIVPRSQTCASNQESLFAKDLER